MTTQDSKEVNQEQIRLLNRVFEDPSKFCEYILGTTPFSYQAKFLSDKSKRIVVCAGRQVGKSFMTSARAIWFAITHAKTTTLIVSHTLRQSMLMFDKIIELVYSSPVMRNFVSYRSRTRINFDNGSWIIALPCGRTGSTLRGFTAHLVVIDEAAFVPEQVISEVVLPMLATTRGTAILLSTPYDKAHIFYRVFASPTWSKYQFPSQVNPMITMDFLEEHREIVGEQRYRKEFLAEFVDDEKAYFPMSLLRSCVHACANPASCEFCDIYTGLNSSKGVLFGGYDPGGSVDPAAFIEIDIPKGVQRDKALHRCLLLHKYLRQRREISDDNLYTRFTVQISDVHQSERWKMSKMLVDTQGIGKPIIEHCKSLKLPAEEMPMTQKNKEMVFSHLRLKLEQRLIELPNDLDLLANLNCMEAERTRNGGYVFSHPVGTHDDLAHALALAVYAASGKVAPTVIMMKRE